ncbi:mucin-17-like [Heptranchias perlo]|uniref:mucin-17-like n=1 Tax=Heptranchias perlo TaxID=212740 RepID=UPI003559DD62
MELSVIFLFLWGSCFRVRALDSPSSPRFRRHVSVQYFDYPEEIACTPLGVMVRIRNDSFQGMSIRLSVVDDYGIPRDFRSLPSSCKYRTIPQADGSLLFSTPYNGCYVHLMNKTVSMELRIDGIDASRRIIVIERIPVNCTLPSLLPPLVPSVIVPTWITVGSIPVDVKPVNATPGATPLDVKPVNATPGVTPVDPVNATPGVTPVDVKPVNATPGATPVDVKPVNATPGVTPFVKPVNATPGVTPFVKPVNATPGATPVDVKPVNATPGVTPLDVKPVNATPGATPVDVKPVNATSGVTPVDVKPVNATPGATPLDVKPVNATPGVTPVDVKPVNATPGVTPVDVKPVNATPGVTPVDVKPVNVTPGVTPVDVKPVNATPGLTPFVKPVNATPGATPVDVKPVNATPGVTPFVKPVNATPGATPVDVKPVNATPGVIPVDVKPVNATPGVTPVDVKPVNATPGVTPVDVKPVNVTPGVTPVDVKPVNVTPGVTPVDVKPVNATPGLTPFVKPVNATPGATPVDVKPVNATPGVTPFVKPVNATPGATPLDVKPVNATPGATPVDVKPVNATPGLTPFVKPVNATPGATPVDVKPVNATPGVTPFVKPVNATPGATPLDVKPVNATPGATPVDVKPVNATLGVIPVDVKPVNATPGVTPVDVKPVNATPGVTPFVKPVNATPGATPLDVKPVNATPGATPVDVKPVNATLGVIPVDVKPVNATPGVTPVDVKPVNATPGLTPFVKPVNATPGATPVDVKPVNATPGATPVDVKPVNATPGVIPVDVKPVNATPGVTPVDVKPVNATPGVTPFVKPVNATPGATPVDVKINGDMICDIDAKDRVDCGNATLGELACGAKGCCYDPVNVQTPCFYGKTAYIDCTNNGLFTIVVPRVATVPPLNLGSVYLVNNASSECIPVARTSEFIVFSFPLNSCGSMQMIDGQNITYTVDIIAKRRIRNGPRGSITRDSTFRLHVICHLTGSRNIPLMLVVNTPSPLPFVVKDGVLKMEMRIAKEESYSTWFADEDYPIVKFLREPVYVEVHLLHRVDANIALVLNDCWATQTSDPHHGKQWSILVNGCPYYGDNYLTQLHAVEATSSLLFPTHHKRFEVKTFAFWGREVQAILNGEVYFHCSATVCLLSEMEKCATTCDTGKRIARSSDFDTSTESLQQGLVTLKSPIIFTLAEENSVAESTQANENIVDAILLAAVVTSLALALIAGLVLCWNCKQMCKRKSYDYGIPRDFRSLPSSCKYRTIPQADGSLLFSTPYNGCYVHLMNKTVSMELRIDGIDASRRIIVIERIPVNCTLPSLLPPLVPSVIGVTPFVKPVNATLGVTPVDVKPVNATPGVTPVDVKPVNATPGATPVDVKPVNATPGATPVDVKPVNATPGATPLDVKPVNATPGATPVDVKPVNATPGATPLDVKPVNATPGATPVDVKPVNATPGATPVDVKPVNATPGVTPVDVKPVNVTPGVTPVDVKPVNATPGLTPFVKPVNATPGATPVDVKPVNATPGVTPFVKPVNATPGATPVDVKPVNATPGATPVDVKPVNATPGVTPFVKPVNATPGATPVDVKPVNATPGATPVDVKPVNATPGATPVDVKPVNATPGVTPVDVKPVNATPGLTPFVKPVNATPGATPVDVKPVNATPGVTPFVKPVNATPGATPVDVKPVNATPGATPVDVKPVNATPGVIPVDVKPVNATPGVTPFVKPVNATPGVTPFVKPVNATPGATPVDVKINGDMICDIDAKDRVDCGNATLGELACGAKGCCYDPVNVQTPCFYGKTAYIDCTNNGLFTIVVPRVATVPPLNLGSVYLVNNASSECIPVARTSEFIVFSFPLNSCGSMQMIDGQNITYTVDIIAKRRIRNGPRGSITRDSTFRLHVICHLTGSRNIPLMLVVNTPSPLPFVVKDGVLKMEMRIAKEESYSTWFADEDYPIVKFLREPVYVEVHLLHRVDANIALVLNDCWATQTSDPHHGKQWSILVNGCPYYGDNYLTQLHAVEATSSLLFPTHHKRFEVKTFAFWGREVQAILNGEVYFHCSATVCLLSEMEKCATTCDTGKRIARSSDFDTSTESLQQGLVTLKSPIIFTLAEENSVAESSQANENIVDAILLAAVVTSLALALIAGLVLCWNCKQMCKRKS